MKVTVVGLGHVGIVAATGLALAGHQVLATDVDHERIHLLNRGKIPLYEPGLDEWVTSVLTANAIEFLHLNDIDQDLGEVALIAVGTPHTPGNWVDLTQVVSALSWLKMQRPDNLVIAMKSTVPPGTGLRLIHQELSDTNLSYVSNPEFLREGTALADWVSPNRIVIGVNQGDTHSVETLTQLHQGINAPQIITDITSAEMVKYASNAFLATRIAFINEVAELCDSVGASIDDVSDGLALDSRIGGKIYAGVGYGGSCFSKDLRALDYLACTRMVQNNLLQSVVESNSKQRLLPLATLRKRFNDSLRGLRIAVLGLAFKPGTDDLRDAPAIDLVKAFVSEGIEVVAFDPKAMPSASSLLPQAVHFANSALEAAQQAQALVLMTEWTEILKSDWQAAFHAMAAPRLLFDGRNALDAGAMQDVGFEYIGVGRNG